MGVPTEKNETILVVDQGTEIFWFSSRILGQDEKLQKLIYLKHINNIALGEEFILKELPKIVILNGDDPNYSPVTFIGKMRNHVFARNTLFVVITSNTNYEFRRSLLIAGAAQVFYKNSKEPPSSIHFKELILWLLHLEDAEKSFTPSKFEESVKIQSIGDFTTYGRIGWISSDKVYIEINLVLKEGQRIDFGNSHLSEELNIKNIELVVLKKDPTGRYYQYAHGYLCKIDWNGNDSTADKNRLHTWIKQHAELSKEKPVKVVYFDSDGENRNEIKNLIKFDRRYCARGYGDLKNFPQRLEYQRPNLILINTDLFSADKVIFVEIKKFIKNHLSYCITYGHKTNESLQTFQKEFPEAMHIKEALTEKVFGPMTEKLEAKILSTRSEDDKKSKKIYFSKNSPMSRISLKTKCSIVQLSPNGLIVTLPFVMASFCSFNLVSPLFNLLTIHSSQYLRNQSTNPVCIGEEQYAHHCLFFGQIQSESKIIDLAIKKISSSNFEDWKLSL